jgi:elongation factor 1-gamma
MTVTQAPIGTLHFVEEAIYKAQKAMVAAKFNGLEVTPQKFDIAKEGKKPAFLEMNPMSKVPFLQTDAGCITSSNAIARYVARCRADTSLYGKCFDDEGQIDTWMEFCTYELEVPLAVWLYPVLGLMEVPAAAATDSAKGDVKKALQQLEDRLKKSPFLIGDFVSLADITVVCSLKEAFTRIFDPAFRKPFPKVCAWYETCTSMPQFSAVFGAVTLCKEAEKPKAVKTPVVAKKDAGKDAGAAKKEEKKPEPKAKAAGKAEATPPAAAAVSAEDEAKMKALGDEIRQLKEKLKGEGVTGKKLNDHPDIVSLVGKLNALKSGAATAPAAAKPPAADPKKQATPPADVEAQIKLVGDDIRVLKEKLKGEGITGKKLNEHPEIGNLVEKLNGLKAQMGGTPPPAPAPPAAPAGAAAAASGSKGDVEADIKAVGDEIRALKEKLKGEGLSGKKMNEHPEIKTLVAKLSELKAAL